ncbi:MAG: glutamine amidotransferase, partial [Pseudomonadota bacterium]
LVSGEPHPGGRAWRDLLKADPMVDLIHFTILRPPAKQDGTPVSELSLIAFPTRELFLDKIDGFDLIVFDRYRWRGVLASAYLANIARYVREGGAVFVASGPAFAGAQSLARTPLVEVLPARPTVSALERPYLPRVSAVGERHPVTQGLEAAVGLDEEGPRWGRWLRQIEVSPRTGATVMTGIDELPLLVLDRVGEGRVALLASDHAWLWSRGYEGGGPQADLLRRTAHWLMREPELEEEALMAHVEGDSVLVERRSLLERPADTVIATAPDGTARELTLAPDGPGRWRTRLDEPDEGLWRFASEGFDAVAAVGPPAPREYAQPIATDAPLGPLVAATGGATVWLDEAGVPDLRLVSAGRRAQGRGWIGLAARDAYRVTGIRLTPLMPAWLAALATGLLFLAAWRREGR